MMNYGPVNEKFGKEIENKTGLIKQFLKEIYDEILSCQLKNKGSKNFMIVEKWIFETLSIGI